MREQGAKERQGHLGRYVLKHVIVKLCIGILFSLHAGVKNISSLPSPSISKLVFLNNSEKFKKEV